MIFSIFILNIQVNIISIIYNDFIILIMQGIYLLFKIS